MDIAFTKILTTILLFLVTAVAEILGCYFPYLILNQNKSHWLWIPTVLSLAVFVWLLTLHPAASGRIYAAYGGIYIFSALMWAEICRSSQFNSLGFVWWLYCNHWGFSDYSATARFDSLSLQQHHFTVSCVASS